MIKRIFLITFFTLVFASANYVEAKNQPSLSKQETAKLRSAIEEYLLRDARFNKMAEDLKKYNPKTYNQYIDDIVSNMGNDLNAKKLHQAIDKATTRMNNVLAKHFVQASSGRLLALAKIHTDYHGELATHGDAICANNYKYMTTNDQRRFERPNSERYGQHSELVNLNFFAGAAEGRTKPVGRSLEISDNLWLEFFEVMEALELNPEIWINFGSLLKEGKLSDSQVCKYAWAEYRTAARLPIENAAKFVAWFASSRFQARPRSNDDNQQ